MNTQYFKKILKYWVIPPGFMSLMQQSTLSFKKVCASNIEYKNKHQGQRCFIVCSGPSIKKQNLLLLKNEITFFVSAGFLHPDYSAIQPDYHCVVPILPTPESPLAKHVEYFKRMDNNIGNTQLFLSACDEKFIKQNNLFSNRRVSYLHIGSNWNPNRKKIYDLTQRIPGMQSVPIMAIMVAMYMGCKEIYLLGVEVDEIWRGEYKHFYDKGILRNDIDVDEDGKTLAPMIEMFMVYYNLWQQFSILKNIAEANNIEIFNATQGGALNVYKRVIFEDLFKK